MCVSMHVCFLLNIVYTDLTFLYILFPHGIRFYEKIADINTY